jgi:hypothetical protein
MLRSITWTALVLLAAMPAWAQERTPAPEGAQVYIIAPEDGATLTSPVTVLFGLEGLGVAPAGVEQEGTAHHHLIIDADLPPVDEPIPADDNYVHFGGGQTQTTVELEPGEHTLQLLMGDLNHYQHEPPVYSEVVTITVE